MREWYLEAFNSYEEELNETQKIENMNAEFKHRLSETASVSSSSSTFVTNVSRREESKVSVPPWPKVNDLGLWKANLIQEIVIVANDSDQQPWIDWVKEAIDDPDPDKLMDSGDPRFHSIDAKLGPALTIQRRGKQCWHEIENTYQCERENFYPYQRKRDPSTDTPQLQDAVHL